MAKAYKLVGNTFYKTFYPDDGAVPEGYFISKEAALAKTADSVENAVTVAAPAVLDTIAEEPVKRRTRTRKE